MTQACELLVDSVLDLSVFSQFLVVQEHHTLKKQIAHLTQEDCILQSEYLKLWENSIKYELYTSLIQYQ